MRKVITAHVIVYFFMLLFVTTMSVWSKNRQVITIEALDESYYENGIHLDPYITQAENEELLEK